MTPPPYSDPQGVVFIDHADAPEWKRVMPFLQFPVIDEPYAENSITGSYAQNGIGASLNQAGGKFHREVATPDPDGFIPFHTPENTYERT